MENLKSILETLIFVSGKPLGTSDMIEALAAGVGNGEKPSKKELEEALSELQREWESRSGGIRLQKVAEGYEFRSAPEYAVWIRALDQPKPQKLSVSAVETLAMVAYRQPMTRSDIEAVRGVDSGGVLKTLADRDLIRIVGRKEEAGRPLLYATTGTFLEIFGLKDLEDLPPLSEFEEMIKSQGAQEASGEEARFTLEDLVSTAEELAEVADSDREALQDLDEKMEALKQTEKSAVAATTPLPEESAPGTEL